MADAATIFRIALVGGEEFCKEVLEKYLGARKVNDFAARIVAVADRDYQSPGMVLAKKLGLIALEDYHELYNPQHDIKALLLMTPDEAILDDILRTKPISIRLVAYPLSRLFFRAIDAEHQKLRARNEEIETILNSIQDVIIVISLNMEIQEINQSFLDQMGYTREEVVGKKCRDVFQQRNCPCDISMSGCPLNRAIEERGPSQQILTRMDRDGETHHLDVKIFPVWDKEGKISKFIEVSRDISDTKKREEEMTRRLEKMVEDRTRELKNTHTKLIHQDKMASLGKLSASVVHEINNPISGILSLVMLMNRMMEEGKLQRKEEGQFKEYLQLMETETRRISRIVSNLLAFSRQSKMEFGNVKLNQLIAKTLFLNANLLRLHCVKVEEDLAPDLPDLVGSEDRLQQVFVNLVSNAAEAVEAGGGERLLRIRTRYLPEKKSVCISFADTGVGINKENLPNLFEPFFSTKKKGKGVGLGLSVAYGIIQEHDGSIHVQSEEGKGTTFTIELPLKMAQQVFQP
ncbi:MAG: PAS domain S-box protein [Deltaproteobacteria bacterium]|nr:PAS domain S-box protein [Deltaproteobacteria bacterium]